MLVEHTFTATETSTEEEREEEAWSEQEALEDDGASSADEPGQRGELW